PDARATADLREIPDATREAVGDARRAARTSTDLERALGARREAEQRGRPRDDEREFVVAIELEAFDDLEALAQRCRQQRGARGGTDQGERRQGERHRSRAAPL